MKPFNEMDVFFGLIFFSVNFAVNFLLVQLHFLVDEMSQLFSNTNISSA